MERNGEINAELVVYKLVRVSCLFRNSILKFFNEGKVMISSFLEFEVPFIKQLNSNYVDPFPSVSYLKPLSNVRDILQWKGEETHLHTQT